MKDRPQKGIKIALKNAHKNAAKAAQILPRKNARRTALHSGLPRSCSAARRRTDFRPAASSALHPPPGFQALLRLQPASAARLPCLPRGRSTPRRLAGFLSPCFSHLTPTSRLHPCPAYFAAVIRELCRAHKSHVSSRPPPTVTRKTIPKTGLANAPLPPVCSAPCRPAGLLSPCLPRRRRLHPRSAYSAAVNRALRRAHNPAPCPRRLPLAALHAPHPDNPRKTPLERLCGVFLTMAALSLQNAKCLPAAFYGVPEATRCATAHKSPGNLF